MTTTETLFGDAPIGDNDRLRTQLASVQLLVARSDRDVAHNDIVIATMFEVLEDGPLSRSELFRRVEQAWSLPGASNTLLDEALRHAVLIEHVETRDEHGVEVVHLLDRGRECLAESRRHADDCLCRFRSQLGDELLTRDFYLDAVELESLAAVVLATLRHAIGQALRAQVGLQTAGQRVAVAAPNAASLEAFVSARVPDEDRAALVVALTLVCLDQSRPIGQEIVHQLAKGHLLYRFMARPDLAAAADHAGPLSGVRLIIDTPMLVRMLGPTAVRQPVLALLVEARKQGMEVVIYQRTVDELERLLNRTEDVSAPEWEAAMAKHGIEVALATVLSRVDGVIWSWLTWAQHQPRTQRGWDIWRRSMSGQTGVLGTLHAIGLEVVPDRSKLDIGEAGREGQFEQALKERLADRNAKRGDEVLHHDAMHLRDVWACRDAAPASDTVWPAAFILTSDTFLNDTYRSVTNEPFPVALSFEQCAAILGGYAAGREREQFADDIAPGIAEDVLLARAVNVPTDMVQSIARALGPEPVSASEAEQLQLDLQAMFNTASDTDVKPGDVVERLRDRRRAARDEAARAAEEDRRRHEVSEAGRLAREAAKDKQLSTAHQKLADTTDELARQKALRTEDEQKQQSQQVQQRRLRWIERVALVVAFVVVALAWNEAWRWAIRVAIAGVVGFIYAREWVKSGTRPGIAAVAGVLAIGEALTLAG